MGEVSKADWSWINQAADEFERACKAGSRPRIEDFLARATAARRGPLLDELLRVECEIRRRQGEKPAAEEYRRRFPDYLAIVDAVFAPESLRSVRSRGIGPASAHQRAWRRWTQRLPPRFRPSWPSTLIMRSSASWARRHGSCVSRPQPDHGPG